MGLIHDILEEKGRQAALNLDFPRQEIEAASSYMSDEDQRIGFLYSGWCQAALPHRRLADDSKGWQIDSDHVCLIIQPGMRRGPTGNPIHVGVPYGSRARLILLYMQSEAIRTNCRDIELGKSLRSWMKRMSIPIGGKNLESVREQAERLSRCQLSFEVVNGRTRGITSQKIMESSLFLEPDPNIDTVNDVFMLRARLSTEFFEGLKKHPVPFREAAIRALSNNSMALDIYSWLAYRLHSLDKPTPITWKALKSQFGTAYSQMNNFRGRFLPNLKLALAAYPEAHVTETDGKVGMTLHPSPPPVRRQIYALK
ncbi:replication protein RepA [Acetobacter malorum]|uniref:replication protein RepA n=1 Tax=Acetobacter malorum TaxID=178901 RepID=UPI000777EEAD|nr:replication protein RepA [Acetobacter malorum]KXV05780.1 plasmid replication initiator [Acetobacter malorum]